MPITFKVDDVSVEKVKPVQSAGAALHYLEHSTLFHNEGLKADAVIRETPWNPATARGRENGFVYGVVTAYNQHHKLILRPDDVWLAIAVQFGLFVNGHSEELRSHFVQHEGKKDLTVQGDGNLATADYETMLSDGMVKLLKANVIDQDLCDWVLPSFSTTTKNDVIVGSVVLMASMKSYFSYKMELCCGIPEITLLGTVEDWKLIRTRVEKLRSFGKECNEWADMLVLITDNFVKTANGDIPRQFWQTMCHWHSGGSGPSYLSGWITAFCVFSADSGHWQGGNKTQSHWGRPIEGYGYPIIKFSDVPGGYLTTPVIVDDNGRQVDCVLYAGHALYTVVDDDTIQPTLTWALFEK